MDKTLIKKFFVCFLLLTILLSPSPLFCNKKTAKEHLAKAKALFQEKKMDQGLEETKKAESADPENARISYSVGELLLKKTEFYKEALAAYKNAWKRGYQKGIVPFKQGKCYYYLKQYKKSIPLYKKSIKINKKTLKTAKKKHHKLLKYQLAHAYGRIEHEYSLMRDFVNAHKYAKKGMKYDAKGFKKRVIRTAFNAGHLAFGKKQYQKALKYYKKSFQDPITKKRYKKLKRKEYPDWRIPTNTLINVVKRRMKLGKIKPKYVHKILVIFITDQTVDIITSKGHKFKGRKVITQDEIDDALERLQWLKQIIESISDGNYSLAIIPYIDKTPYNYKGSNLKPWWVGDGETIFKHINKVDTIIRCWAHSDQTGTGGAGYFYYVPFTIRTPLRGFVNIRPKQSHGMWLHEFFHVLENFGPIKPTHGYYEYERAWFPKWKGDTFDQLDYFKWHFRTTFKKFGWKKMNFHIKHPEKKITLEVVKKRKEAVKKISPEDLEKAEKMVKKSWMVNSAKGIQLCKDAIKINPFQPEALKRLARHQIYYYQNADKAMEYYNKMLLPAPEDKPEKLRTPFDKFYLKVRSFGQLSNYWYSTNATSSGSDLKWDISKQINSSKEYTITFHFTGGNKYFDFNSVTLFENNKEINTYTDKKRCSHGNRVVQYKFIIKNYNKNNKYILKTHASRHKKTDCFGALFVK